MAIVRSLVSLLIAAVALVALPPATEAGEAEVDLALVLAVDVSQSMEPEEQELQRQGFVEAFRSPSVHEAIRKGVLGRISVIYMEWSGPSDQKVVVPWSIVEGSTSALDFADRLAQSPPRRAGYTSISGAIDFSVGLFGTSSVEPSRQVIDISGDGPSNQGRAVTQARDDAVAQGIVINGLPIMLKRPNSVWDIENLDLYYRNCVIGGPGAFLVPVRAREHFVEAIKTKIIREIAGHSEARPTLRRAQADAVINCFAGELRRQQRYGN